DWLRIKGYKKSAELTDSDLQYLLKRVRQAAIEGGSVALGDRPAFMTGESAVRGATKKRLEDAALKGALYDKREENERLERIRQELDDEYSSLGTVDEIEVDRSGLEVDEDGDLTDDSIDELYIRAEQEIAEVVESRKIKSFEDIDHHATQVQAYYSMIEVLDELGLSYRDVNSGGSSWYIEVFPGTEKEMKFRFSDHARQTRLLEHEQTGWNWVVGRDGVALSDMIQSLSTKEDVEIEAKFSRKPESTTPGVENITRADLFTGILDGLKGVSKEKQRNILHNISRVARGEIDGYKALLDIDPELGEQVRSYYNSEMFSDGFNTPSEAVTDWLKFKAVDKLSSLKKTQTEIEKTYGELADAENTYMQETLYHGRAQDKIERIERNYVEPIKNIMGIAKIDLADVDDYIYALHAHEANERLRKINPTEDELDQLKAETKERIVEIEGGELEQKGLLSKVRTKERQKALERELEDLKMLLDGYKTSRPYSGDNTSLSGMSNEEADEVLSRWDVSKPMENIAAKVRQMLDENLDRIEIYGLESADAIEAMRGTYDNYVPLKGHELEGKGAGTGAGFHIRGKETQRRTGRTTKAQNILAQAVADVEKTIVRAEKNKVGQSLLRLVSQNPNSEMWEVNKPERSKAIDKVTGLVKDKQDPTYQLRDNVLSVKVHGEEHHITFNEDNVHAMRIATAMKNLSGKEMNVFLKGAAAMNRYLAMINTSLNPEFVITNLERDLQTAMINMQATDVAEVKAKVMKGVPGAIRGIYRAQRGKGYLKGENSYWQKEYEEFRAAGGQTGWVDLHADTEVKAEAIRKELAGGGMFRKSGMKAIHDLMMDANTAVENGVRLSAYTQARKLGASKDKAANMAKNLTVNFNRKGDAGQMINAGYLFFNASIQGMSVMLTALKNKKARRMVYGVIAMSAILDMVNRAIGGDDEDGEALYDGIPDHVRERNFILMRADGSGEYDMFTKPYGYSMFATIGEEIGKAFPDLGKKNYSPADGALRVASSSIDAFNPLGGFGSVLQLVSPTVIDPFVQIAENKSFFGAPIKPEAKGFGKTEKPEYQQHWASAREISKDTAKWLNDMTGGTEVRPGAVNWSPEHIDHWLDFIGGGVAKTAANTASTLNQMFSEDDLARENIPLIRRMHGKVDHVRNVRDEYLEYATDIEYTLKAWNEAKKRGNIAPLDAEVEAKKSLIFRYKSVEKRLKKLRSRKKMIDLRNIPDAQKKLEKEKVQAEITGIHRDFNGMYEEKVLGL
ncbi:MAG: hypothetical protein HOE44_03115, partial [Candidatus Marinimicrobia bacterium]|nr:hypothetical protein [Candidatus Neomarinimicrobiota bacterium]